MVSESLTHAGSGIAPNASATLPVADNAALAQFAKLLERSRPLRRLFATARAVRSGGTVRASGPRLSYSLVGGGSTVPGPGLGTVSAGLGGRSGAGSGAADGASAARAVYFSLTALTKTKGNTIHYWQSV